MLRLREGTTRTVRRRRAVGVAASDDLALATLLEITVRHVVAYWLECPEATVIACWMPSQASHLLAVRRERMRERMAA